MNQVPLRCDFAGGWLDVPRLSRLGGFIVNCAIQPMVSLESWPYHKNAGLGGSAAWSLLNGKNPFETEDDAGVGWQDPAVIQETGLCVWRSGTRPELDLKRNPSMLSGVMALYWTGSPHVTADLVDLKRDYESIVWAGQMAARAVEENDIVKLCRAVTMSYSIQKTEGMADLPDFGQMACKYVGGGHGGYAVYVFRNRPAMTNLIPIEPYLKPTA